jgi:hypothetical protein
MINAWSLAWEVLNGTMDETYPIREDIPAELWGKKIDMSVGAGNTASTNDEVEKAYNDYYGLDNDDGLDYEIDYMSDIDDMYSHQFTTYDDGMSLQVTEEQNMNYEPRRNHQYKYHEEEILKDIEEYVSRTYQGHYTGTKHEFRKVQTIDLMAARDIAPQFCQANILKYGSRYGSKDGRNKTDLLKVIHYAMLLLHFDGHYGEPSMPSGNFEQMP